MLFFRNFIVFFLLLMETTKIHASYGGVEWEYNRAEAKHNFNKKTQSRLSHSGFMTHLNDEIREALGKGNFNRAIKIADHFIAYVCAGKPLGIRDKQGATLDEFVAILKGSFFVARVVELTGNGDFYDALMERIHYSFDYNSIDRDAVNTAQTQCVMSSILVANALIQNKEKEIDTDVLGATLLSVLEDKNVIGDFTEEALNKTINDIVVVAKSKPKVLSSILGDIKRKFSKSRQETRFKINSYTYHRDITNNIDYLEEKTNGNGFCYFNGIMQKESDEKYDCDLYIDAIKKTQGEDRKIAKKIISTMVINHLKRPKPPSEKSFVRGGSEERGLKEQYLVSQKFKSLFGPFGIQEVDDLITLKMIAEAKADIATPLKAIMEKRERIAKDDNWGEGKHKAIRNIFQFFRENPDAPSVDMPDDWDESVKDFYARVCDYFIRRLADKADQSPEDVIDAVDGETGPRVSEDIMAIVDDLFSKESVWERDSEDIQGRPVIEELSCYDLTAINGTDAADKVLRDYNMLMLDYNKKVAALDVEIKKRAKRILDNKVTYDSGDEGSLLEAIASFDLYNLPWQDVPSDSNLGGLFLHLYKINGIILSEQQNFSQEVILYEVDPRYPYRPLYLNDGHYTRLKPLGENNHVLND
ncbi:MAG: hypothetical protein K2X98_06100 [Alphaproteobacteria bacterium]|nr:hypothetical protein [Alphaproteobacteria bacterium]